VTVEFERNPPAADGQSLSGQTTSSFLQSSSKDQTATTGKLDKVADCAEAVI
jgi:hypothetical protein